MRSGQSRHARFACLALLLILSDVVTSQTPAGVESLQDATSYIEHTEMLAADTLPSITVRFLVDPRSTQKDRVIGITMAALRLFGEWVHAYPASHLTVVAAGWPTVSARSADTATIVVPSRWLAPASDVGLERALIRELARSYFAASPAADSGPNGFGLAVAHYAAARAINQLLEGRNVLTCRFFGGFVPYSFRQVSLSRVARDERPIVRSQAVLHDGCSAEAARDPSGALHTLERFIGFPAMQQALVEFVALARPAARSAQAFIEIVNRQRGSAVEWWPADPTTLSFDYGVAALSTTATQASPEAFTTQLQVRRYGELMVVDPPRLAILTRFADGTHIDEHWKGVAEAANFTYMSSAPAISAAIDPGAVYLVDTNRLNNVRALRPPATPLGWRLAANWVTWLQHFTLTYLAIA